MNSCRGTAPVGWPHYPSSRPKRRSMWPVGRRTSERPGAGSSRASRRTPAGAGRGGEIARGVRGGSDADSGAARGPPSLWDGGERRPTCGEGRAAATRGGPVAPRAARPVCRVVAVHLLFFLVLVAAWTAAGGHCRPWTRNADRRLGCTVARRPRGGPPAARGRALPAQGSRRSASHRPRPHPPSVPTLFPPSSRWAACGGGVDTAGGGYAYPPLPTPRARGRAPGGGTRWYRTARAPRARFFCRGRPRARPRTRARSGAARLVRVHPRLGVQATNQRRARARTRASSRSVGGALAGPRPAPRPPAAACPRPGAVRRGCDAPVARRRVGSPPRRWCCYPSPSSLPSLFGRAATCGRHPLRRRAARRPAATAPPTPYPPAAAQRPAPRAPAPPCRRRSTAG